MANQLFIGVPNDVEEPETLRLFLVQFVVRISTVLGQDPGVTLPALNEAIQEIQQQLSTGISLAAIDATLPTASVTYEQTELQDTITKLQETITQLNAVISALKSAGIAL